MYDFVKPPWKIIDNGDRIITAYCPDTDRAGGDGSDRTFVCDLQDFEYVNYASDVEKKATARLLVKAPTAYALLYALANGEVSLNDILDDIYNYITYVDTGIKRKRIKNSNNVEYEEENYNG